MYSCQQNLINPKQQLNAVLEFICLSSHKLTHCGIYYARQLYFQVGRIVGKFNLINDEDKDNKHDQVLYSQVAQQTLISVSELFKSFQALDKKYRKGEQTDQPRLPKYPQTGYALVTYPKQALKLIEGIKDFWLDIPGAITML
ncbi:hypothetical protein H6G06_06925 [Anabaena sphaerica FACHB-251]|uniref:Uncharacterized protein n=1 Tax=Anabaena sphaerica FACHB-251 TaxID=2692883 RepID=A0A927A040_9NOST|nr:hypothetical protein [Anabaena sphaerica FACHB-251]